MKTCRSKRDKKYRQTEKYKATQKRYHQSEKCRVANRKRAARFRIKYPDHFKARQVVNNAIVVGRLPRPDTLQCHYCQKQAAEYHHWDGYAKEHWFDVIPICTKCHGNIYRLSA